MILEKTISFNEHVIARCRRIIECLQGNKDFMINLSQKKISSNDGFLYMFQTTSVEVSRPMSQCSVCLWQCPS